MLLTRLCKIIFLSSTLLTLAACSDLTPGDELSQGLSKSASQVLQDGGQLKVIIPSDGNFVGGSKLSVPMQQILAQVAHTLNHYPDLRVKIIAYTDNRSGTKTAQLVTLKRAMRVADYFRNHGISSARISMEGLGGSKPIADNRTSQGRMKNRRVEIDLY